MEQGTHIRSVVLAGLVLAALLQASWAAAADVLVHRAARVGLADRDAGRV
jgi:hypothetical protein